MYKLGIIIGDKFGHASFNLKRQKFHLGQFVWVKSVYGVSFSKSDKKSFRISTLKDVYEIYDIKKEHSCEVDVNEIYFVNTNDIFYSQPNNLINGNEKRGICELPSNKLISSHIEKPDGIHIQPEVSYFCFKTSKGRYENIYFNEIDNYNYFPFEEVYVGFHFENQEKEYVFKMPIYLYTYFMNYDVLTPIKVCVDNNFNKFAYRGNKLIFTAVYTSCPDKSINYKTIDGYYNDIIQRFVFYSNVQNTIFRAIKKRLDMYEIVLGAETLHSSQVSKIDIQNYDYAYEQVKKIITTLCPHFKNYTTNWDVYEKNCDSYTPRRIDNNLTNITDFEKSYTGTYKPTADLYTTISKDCINSLAELDSELNKVSLTAKITNKKKGENKMKNIFDNFKFGKYEDGNIAYSIKGMAYYTDQLDWVSLGEDGSLTKVNDFIIDGMDKFIYVMPVAINNIKKGDIILHHDAPMFVRTVLDNSLTVISPTSAEVKQIIPEKNIFGFNFVSKIVDVTNGALFNNANKDNPFGNLLPFMLMSDNDSSMKNILPFMLMQNNNFGDMNPMMLAFMMKDKNMDNILPLMFMQNQNLFNLQTIDNSIKEEVEETKDKNEEESSIKMGFQG